MSNTEKSRIDLAPEEIRAIRERLGLSQVEAGELLGGGPRAFTKYESGTISPGGQAQDAETGTEALFGPLLELVRCIATACCRRFFS